MTTDSQTHRQTDRQLDRQTETLTPMKIIPVKTNFRVKSNKNMEKQNIENPGQINSIKTRPTITAT